MKIKHKDLPGTYITLPNGREILITAHNGEIHNKSKHQYFCPVCAKDPEIFGDGCFWSKINDLRRGYLSCGCGKHPKWSRHQYHVRSSRAAIAKGLVYYGFSEKFKGWNTKLNIWCPQHGPLKSATPTSLCVVGQGCRKCYDIRVRERSPNNQEVMDKYLVKCGYPRGTTLRRLDKKDASGARRFFEVICPLCSKDEYVMAGVCDGVFETNSESLASGYKACRCSKTYKLTEKIAAHQCESLLNESGLSFKGWKTGYIDTRSKAVANCPQHGDFYPTLGSIRRGSVCPGCSNRTKLTNTEILKKHKKKSQVNPGSFVKRIDGNKIIFYCSKCAIDEISQAGLCDGVFETSDSCFLQGSKPCRCARGYKRPEKVAKFQMESLLCDSGYNFIGFNGGYNGSLSMVDYECKEHGLVTQRLWTILSGSRCRDCSSSGYKTSLTGYCYLMVSRCKRYMKIGITNFPGKRYSQLVSSTPFEFDQIFMKELDGKAAPVMERMLLKNYKNSGFLGFDGATEWRDMDRSVFSHFY